MKTLKEFIAVLIVFAYLFVGDYIFLEIPAFLFVWFVAVFYRFLYLIRFSKKEILIQVILFIVFSPLLFRGAYLGNSYEIAIIYAILFANIFPLLIEVISHFRYRRYFMLISIVFLLLTIFLYILGLRSIVFGPNVFYRIVGFSYIIYFILSINFKNIKGVFFLITYLSTLTTALATQSRAALLLSLILGALTFTALMRNYKYKYFVFFLAVISFSLIYLNVDSIFLFFGRSAYFDINNASEATRLDFLYYVVDYYNNLTLNEFFIGLGYPNRYFYLPGYYPHNLFSELFVSFGGLYFSIYLIVFFLSALKWRKEQWMILIAFLPIYFGALFSGYFGDHSYLLVLPLLIGFLYEKSLFIRVS